MKTTNAQILEATLRVIVRGGLSAVVLRDVAAECGLALGTISYRFRKREELIRSAFAHYLAEASTSIRTIEQSLNIRKPEDLAELMTQAVRAGFADPQKLYLAEYELLVYAASDPEIAEALAQWQRMMTAELGQVVERVGLPAPFATAQSLIEMARGFEVVAMSQPEPDFEEFKKRLLRFVVALKSEPSLPRRKPAKASVRRSPGGDAPSSKPKPRRAPLSRPRSK